MKASQEELHFRRTNYMLSLKAENKTNEQKSSIRQSQETIGRDSDYNDNGNFEQR